MKYLRFSKDGLPITSTFSHVDDNMKLAGLSAAMLGVSEGFLKELSHGDLDQVYIKASHNFYIMLKVREDGLLIMKARNEDLDLKGLKEFMTSGRYKFCKFCGAKFSKEQDICPVCGEKDV